MVDSGTRVISKVPDPSHHDSIRGVNTAETTLLTPPESLQVVHKDSKLKSVPLRNAIYFSFPVVLSSDFRSREMKKRKVHNELSQKKSLKV